MDKPEKFALFIFSVLIIEDDFNCPSETIDLLKLREAINRQPVSFGHFQSIFQKSKLLNQFELIVKGIEENFFSCIKIINETLERKKVSDFSPIGAIAKNGILELLEIPFEEISNFISNFSSWKTENSINSLPFLLSPSEVMNKNFPGIWYSPLPSSCHSYPTFEDLPKIPTPQSYLYHSISFALQQKTTKSIQNAIQFSLKFVENQDESSLGKSSIVLSQIYSLIGMDIEAKLAVAESIEFAKKLQNQSLLASSISLQHLMYQGNKSWDFIQTIYPNHFISQIRSNLSDFISILKTDHPLSCSRIFPFRV